MKINFVWRVVPSFFTISKDKRTRNKFSNIREKNLYIGIRSMVWAGIIFSDHSGIHYFTSVDVNSEIYRDVVLDSQVELFRDTNGNNFLLMEDNVHPYWDSILTYYL